MNALTFTKMHGAGNDFIIIDNRDQFLSIDDIIKLAPRLCHRRFGIGADGIIALQPAEAYDVDYTMIYRNADGSDAGMCGNGARCLALFAARLGLGTELHFNVHEKKYRAYVKPDDNYVQVSFPIKTRVKEVSISEIDGTFYQIYAGTEHLVKEVNAETLGNDKKLIKKGRKLRYHKKFNPPGTNINFIRGTGPSRIKIKTYERGVENLTLACGTGAVAAAIGWHHIQGQQRKENSEIKVQAEGGLLKVNFRFNPDKNSYFDIKLGGEAQFVFEGKIAATNENLSSFRKPKDETVG